MIEFSVSERAGDGDRQTVVLARNRMHGTGHMDGQSCPSEESFTIPKSAEQANKVAKN